MTEQATTTGGRVTEPLRADQTLGELFGALTSDMSALLRQEFELAKVEAKQEAKQAGRAAGMFAAAGVGAWMALLFVSLAVALLLDQAMNTALAFAIVGVVWAIVGAALAVSGKKKIAMVEPLPETITTLKEDVQWAKTPKH